MKEPMEVAEITVQYVNQPKPGKKWGSIKGTDGTAYFGPPATLNKFAPNENCKIQFVRDEKDPTFLKLQGKIEIPQALQRPAPAPVRGRTDPTDSERMGTMGMVNSFITVGAVPLQRDAIKAAINTCRDALNDSWGTPQMQQSKQEFNDEIPH